MAERVRTVRADEWEEFQRFLERSYGHSKGFFTRYYPHIYRTDEEALSSFFVLEKDGRIVSHVGLFPLECVALGCKLTVGGIGGVATLPEERGKGYMSRLLRHVIGQMKERKYPLSALGGDRQRYNPFGWDLAGMKYTLTFTPRSMERAGVVPAEVEEVTPQEASSEVERLLGTLPLRVERRYTLPVIDRPGVRAWLSEDGYVLSKGEAFGPHQILELASPTGKEPELIRAVMERCFCGEVSLQLSAWDEGRLGRLVPSAAGWDAGPDWCYRIVDLAGLLEAYRGWLEARAEGMAPFELSVGVRFQDEVQRATISLRDGNLEVARGRHTDEYYELDALEGVRAFLGGPSQRLGSLSTLLPLPVHIPSLDHV